MAESGGRKGHLTKLKIVFKVCKLHRMRLIMYDSNREYHKVFFKANLKSLCDQYSEILRFECETMGTFQLI